jgi:hypothetical protein
MLTPERDADIACFHFNPQEDPKQLRECDQPEEDRGDERRWPFHRNLLLAD